MVLLSSHQERSSMFAWICSTSFSTGRFFRWGGPHFLSLFWWYCVQASCHWQTTLYLMKRASFSSKDNSGLIQEPSNLNFRVLILFRISFGKRGLGICIAKQMVCYSGMVGLITDFTNIVASSSVDLASFNKVQCWSLKNIENTCKRNRLYESLFEQNKKYYKRLNKYRLGQHARWGTGLLVGSGSISPITIMASSLNPYWESGRAKIRLAVSLTVLRLKLYVLQLREWQYFSSSSPRIVPWILFLCCRYPNYVKAQLAKGDCVHLRKCTNRGHKGSRKLGSLKKAMWMG